MTEQDDSDFDALPFDFTGGEDTTGKVRRFMAGGTLFQQSQLSRDALSALLKKLKHPLANGQEDILLAGVNRAATAYAMARGRRSERLLSERQWRADDQAILKQASSLADKLCTVLAQLPLEARRALDGEAPGMAGTVSTAIQSAQSAKAALAKTRGNLPKLSPTHAFIPEHEVFIHALMTAWQEATGEAANRAINRKGFCAFTEEIAQSLKGHISRGQIEESMLRLQAETAGK